MPAGTLSEAPRGINLTRALGWSVVMAAAAVGMALTTLLGRLGFESSFVLGLLAAFASAHLGAEVVWRARGEASPIDGALADAHPGRAVARLHRRAVGRGLALLAAPLALLALNALRVKNCDLTTGLEWFALLPGLSVVTGSAAGVIAGLAAPKRRIAGTALAVGIVCTSLLWGLAHFYFAPPVFAFDPFAGYFPGSLYDEELPITGTLLAARALHLLGAAAALAGAAALLDGPTLRLRARPRSRRCLLAFAALSIAWLGVRAFAQPTIAPDARSIARTLGARRDTAHLTLLYSQSGPWQKEIDRVAADAEFRYAQLAATFGVEPSGRVTAYLFDSADEKRRLLGASHTQIAKPWRREIYLQYEPWPHPVIKHEFAHVFAGAFGDPIFHVSRRGLNFNVALIEGAAVAADARPERVDLDAQVKILRRFGAQPPMEKIFGPGFLAYPPAQAYTVAGSFCRFLLVQFGAERFRALYRSGGDFAAAYHRPLATLVEAWSKQVDAAPLTDEEVGQSRERLLRPSVFHKVCAHELAIRREQAHAAEAMGDHDRALALFESACRDDPDDPEHLVEEMDALVQAEREPEGMAIAETILHHPKSGEAAKAHALTLLGDALLRRGKSGAAELYDRALGLPLDAATVRQLEARRIAATDPVIGRALGSYLVGDQAGPRDAALDLLRAEQVVLADPKRGLGHYLLGRMLAAHDRPSEARTELSEARSLGLPEGGFAVEALRLEAVSAVRAGDLLGARALFMKLGQAGDETTLGSALSAEAKDWIARCDFFAQPAKISGAPEQPPSLAP